MSKDKKDVREQDEPGLLEGKPVSRREFLKIAGIAGATVGVGAGLGGLVAACGGTTTTTATAATTATTATTAGGETTTTAAGSTTTVSSGAQAGREIKVGVVSPQTGALASFAKPESTDTPRGNRGADRRQVPLFPGRM